MRQKRAPARITVPQWRHFRPVGAAKAVRGARQLAQKRAVARTDALQLGHWRRKARFGAVAAGLPVGCSGRPQRLQKRTPGRNVSPQREHVDAGTCGRVHRQEQQKRACGRLSVPHLGQAFMAARPLLPRT
jgi:hypothetical protein